MTMPRVVAAVVTAATVAGLALALAPARAQGPADAAARVDEVFAEWTPETPGCTVGVSVAGQPVLARAYGLAELEHEVPNAPDTIFEAGSVSKQFTAAAVLLLAHEGTLSLDDPARKYVPELPDYEAPVTIRHMLTHTSGLRDWGSVAGITGWPRTTRVHTHDHVLDIVSRQRSLNFAPGTRWSYSNSGYNLAAIIVSRVSGQSFADFTRTRLFEPLGMTRTSWRDDYTRLVKDRAQAYSLDDEAWHLDMPFEHVHGNGGLLTTVGDLLKWQENFVAHTVGGERFVREQQVRGTFADGRPHGYALGLFIDSYKGVPQVYHSGSTAGYNAYLMALPGQRLSVAVLCNAASARAGEYARKVADVYVGDELTPSPPPAPTHTLTDMEANAVTGVYRSRLTGQPLVVVPNGQTLRVERGPRLVPQSATEFVTEGGDTWTFAGDGARVTDSYGSVEDYDRTTRATPSAADLHPLTGTYVSEDAESTLVAAVDGDTLVLRRRAGTVLRLEPVYPDAFRSDTLGTVIFRRDAQGLVTGLRVSQGRVWDMRFERRPDARPSAAGR